MISQPGILHEVAEDGALVVEAVEVIEHAVAHRLQHLIRPQIGMAGLISPNSAKAVFERNARQHPCARPCSPACRACREYIRKVICSITVSGLVMPPTQNASHRLSILFQCASDHNVSLCAGAPSRQVRNAPKGGRAGRAVNGWIVPRFYPGRGRVIPCLLQAITGLPCPVLTVKPSTMDLSAIT